MTRITTRVYPTMADIDLVRRLYDIPKSLLADALDYKRGVADYNRAMRGTGRGFYGKRKDRAQTIVSLAVDPNTTKRTLLSRLRKLANDSIRTTRTSPKAKLPQNRIKLWSVTTIHDGTVCLQLATGKIIFAELVKRHD